MARIVHLLMDVLGHNGAKDYSKYVFNTMLKKLTGDLGMPEAELARHKNLRGPSLPRYTMREAPSVGQGVP